MSRCYACCQENCGYRSDCGCGCHEENRNKRPAGLWVICKNGKPVSYTRGYKRGGGWVYLTKRGAENKLEREGLDKLTVVKYVPVAEYK